MAQQTQPQQQQQQQQQAAPSASVATGAAAGAGGGVGAGGAGVGGGAGGGAVTPLSTPSTPQPAGVNSNNNNNNNIVSPSGNNNLLTPVQAFAPAGQPMYNSVYMPPHGGHPHAGAHYPTMVQAPMPSNVYVKNVTANVNLHGWSYSVPYLPGGGQPHYIGHGDMPQEQGNLMQHLQPMPLMGPQGGSPNPHTPGMGGNRVRGGRPRTQRGGGMRRNDYHGPRHLQQQQQQPQIVTLPPQQQQQLAQDGVVPGSNQGMQLQPEQMGQQMAPPPPPEAQMQHVPYYAAPPHAYAYGSYPPPYFAPQHAPLQPPPNPAAAAAAQQATGPPLFLPQVMYNPGPMYNCGYFYPVMHPAEYQYLQEEAGQAGVDERVPQPDGVMQPMWHSAPMYAEEYVEVMQQQQQHQQHQHHQQQQQQVGLGHPNGGAPNVVDELNHNSSSLPSSETSSMLSPSYPIYDPQMHDIQHQMGVMQIYDDGQMATLQPIHPGAGPVQQYDDELSECGAAPPGAIPVAWTAAMPMPADAAAQAMMQPPHAPLHIIQQPSPVLIEQHQPQMVHVPHPAQPHSSTPHPQQLQEQLVDKNLINNNNEVVVVALDEKLVNEKPQEVEYQPQQQIEKQPTKVPNLAVATVAPQPAPAPAPALAPALAPQHPGPQQHQQQQTSPVVVGTQNQAAPVPAPAPAPAAASAGAPAPAQQPQPQRKPPQQYNQSQQQQQVRRKYSSEYNHQYHHHGSNDTGIQTTKTMSWTNSAQHKKSTQSVSVTASPNNVNNNISGLGPKTNYSHTTKTYTNQQHYQNQNQNQGQNNNNNNNQVPQVRTYGTMKVPSSPVASNPPTLERKNSQQGVATTQGAPGPTTPLAPVTPITTTTATTSTASTATPNQFPQETGIQSTPTLATASPAQPSPVTAAPQAQPSKSSSYSSYAGSKKQASFDSSNLSTAAGANVLAGYSQPPLNLAPPAPPASQSSAESAQFSWASLFNSNKPVAKVAPYEATKPMQQQQPQLPIQQPAPTPHPVMQLPSPPPPVQVVAPTVVAAPPQQQQQPIQLAPPTAHQQTQLPAPVPAPIAPLVTPGALSYSAASAQAVPPAAPLPTPSSAAVRPLKPEAVRQHLDEWTHKYAEYLTRHKTNWATVSLRPRGLTNRSNYCYINSILQALLGCSPFYNLLRSIPKQAAVLSEVKTPTVNAMMSFMTNFSGLPSGLRLRLNTLNKGAQNKGKDEYVGSDLQCDMAFEPTEIYKLWNDSREEHVEGRQEDAEEFLGYVLNKLNDEMLEVIKLIDKPNVQQNGLEQSEPEDGGDVWQMICNNRNKGSVTRQTDFGRTPISDIFRGELRSRLQREGEHSTDVIQPFFTLQLNIEKAASVKEALEILVGRDQLEGVTGSKTKQEVVAWQQMTLEKLPVVLILHLKYFDYRSDGCTKILKKVEFPVELKIDAKILGAKKLAQKLRVYRLFAVVYHDGKEASKGHYITDVFHTGYSSWLRYDDSSVKPVSEKHVLQPHTPRVPYLLYYRRSDTLTPQQLQQQQHIQQTNGGGAGAGVGSSSSSSNAGDNK